MLTLLVKNTFGAVKSAEPDVWVFDGSAEDFTAYIGGRISELTAPWNELRRVMQRYFADTPVPSAISIGHAEVADYFEYISEYSGGIIYGDDENDAGFYLVEADGLRPSEVQPHTCLSFLKRGQVEVSALEVSLNVGVKLASIITRTLGEMHQIKWSDEQTVHEFHLRGGDNHLVLVEVLPSHLFHSTPE